MMTMVYFTSAGVAYCLPVESTRSVRTVSGLVVLPGARPDVAGILPGQPPITVISALGGVGRRILVVETGDTTFGLLVDSVAGLRRVAAADVNVNPAPAGEPRPLVSGTINTGGELILVADPIALAARL